MNHRQGEERNLGRRGLCPQQGKTLHVAETLEGREIASAMRGNEQVMMTCSDRYTPETLLQLDNGH